MDYLVEKLEKELRTQEGMEAELIDLELDSFEARKKQKSPEFDPNQLHDYRDHAVDHETHLRSAMKAYQRLHEVDDEEIADLVLATLDKNYEERVDIVIKSGADYQGLANILTEKDEKSDCVIMYGEGRVFDPKIYEKWDEHGLKQGDKISVYLHNEDGVSIDDVIGYIGEKVETPRVEVVSKGVDIVKVVNPYGIHARPAALFVKAASEFDADVWVEKEGLPKVSGKSIMGLMTLEASQGTYLKITAENYADAKEAEDVLRALVASGFGEE